MFLLRIIAILWVMLTPAYAQSPTHAIAMHGKPLYPRDFKHFPYTNPDAEKGGILRRAEVGTFDNLNPFLITGKVTSGLQEALLLTYDSLMTRGWDEPFTMYGLVAESVILPEKRNWIEFNLDKRARFHDGKPITTQDVAFSFETLKQYGRPNQRRVYKLVDNVTIKNSTSIRFTFKQGYDRETAFIIAGMPILPKHYWQDKDFSKTTLIPPVGSGPYKIVSIDPGRQVTFERVKNYWARDKNVAKGLYNFDQIHYEFYRDDTVALQALASNRIDLRREWSAVTWKRDYQFDLIQSGEIKRKEFSNGRPARARFFVYNIRRPLFSDRRVRQALAYAFDFEWINKTLFLDTQTRLNSVFMNSDLASKVPPTLPQTDASGTKGLRNNLRKAMNLLQEAGYQLQDGKLIHTRSQTPFSFEILLNDPQDEKIALEFSRNLKRLGIKTTIRTVDTTQYIGRMSQFDFDMTINFWRNSLSPGTEQAVYWGSHAAKQKGSFNYSGLQSTKIDSLIDKLTQTKTRQALVVAARDLDQAVMAEWIGIPLFDAPKDRIAYRKTLNFPEKIPLYGPVLESWWYSSQKSDINDSKSVSQE